MTGHLSRQLVAAAVIAALAVFPACSLKTVKTRTLGNRASAGKVLIAYHHSDFKAEVAEKAAGLLAADGLCVTLTDVARLGGQDPAGYGAVVLMAPVVAWTIDENIRRFVLRSPEKGRVILVTTAGDADFSAGVAGVDAVTEASVPENAGALAHTIEGKVKALLGGE